MDWGAFETAWHDSGCRALAELAAAHPGERLYAAAFHLFYSDNIEILPPALAANTEAAVRQEHGHSTRFAPPEWRWDVLDAASEAMRPWYQRLTDELLPPAGIVAERDMAVAVLESAHDAVMARVCKAMTATARRGGIHHLLPANFVVVILEGQRDEQADLIRASVDPPVLATVPELTEFLRDIERASSDASSPRSPTSSSAVECTTAWSRWKKTSAPGSPCGTSSPDPTPGPRPPTRS